MRLMKVAAAFWAFVAVALVSYAQEAKKDGPVSAPSQSAFSDSQDGHSHGAMKEKLFIAVTGPDGVQHVNITGGEYYFDPNHIVVKVNVPVELTVKQTGSIIPHDIVVKAPQAGIAFDESLKKQPKTIRFIPTMVGKYEMYCSKKMLFIKSHKDKGMDGMIEVVP